MVGGRDNLLIFLMRQKEQKGEDIVVYDPDEHDVREVMEEEDWRERAG